MTFRWFDKMINGEGYSVKSLARELGVDERTLGRKIHKMGLKVGKKPVTNWVDHSVQARCLPGLIHALDNTRKPPRTLEEARMWAERWRAVERLINPGQAGRVAARWITPEDILAIVRTKKYRVNAEQTAKARVRAA